MGALAELKRQWPGIVVGAIPGLALSLYIYLQTREARDPVFVVDANGVEIISRERVANSPITVLHDGVPIRGDVYAARFFFWNAGKRSIRPENVLEPIQITLGDSGSQILDFRSVKASRPVAHVQLTRTRANAQTLLVTFSILERGDGLSGQIIYQGRQRVPLQVTGTIEGAEIRTTAAPSVWVTIGTLAGDLAVIVLVPIVAGALVILVGLVVMKVFGRLKVKEWLERHPRLKKGLRVAPKMVGVGAVILFLVWTFFVVREQQTTNVVNAVPTAIVP